VGIKLGIITYKDAKKMINAPERISESRLAELVKGLRDGDLSTHGEIIEGHIKLAITIAGRYIRICPRKSEELVSESMFGLMYAVKKAQEKMIDDNVTSWIASCCHRFAQRFLISDNVIRVPPTSAKRCGIIVIVTRLTVDVTTASTGPLCDFMDMIESCAKTDFDRKILDLRIQGYNDKEIGESLGVSQQHVSKMRDKMRSRFDAISREVMS
jgi:DNA-directed RNA polymerase specialized sigma subunit